MSIIELKTINNLRILAIDMIEEAKSGHPGMPLGCAPTIFVLWCKIMNNNHENPLWEIRDRFILSNGHGCAILYSMLYMLGYDYTINDLKKFRQLHSKTPGHPEFNQKLGIEASTGPLGQGIANGVGMAIASKKLNINNKIYVICGDGCLMEGISYEACSLAGHLGLNNLIILYDDNGITIDGTTDITFTENVRERFLAMNWLVLEVSDGNNIDDIYDKLLLAKVSTEKPTIIFVKTIIGYGSINAGKSSVHGAPLGLAAVKELKLFYNFDPNKTFQIDEDVIEYLKTIKNKKIEYYNSIITTKLSQKSEQSEQSEHSNIYKQLINLNLDQFKNEEKSYASRDSSNIILQYIVNNLDNIIIGSADLAESNKTMVVHDFIKKDNFISKYLHYGIREHAMAGIANGISTYNILPIISTFFVFITYCLNSIRMAALAKHKVIYVLTHDSVFLGEDGPSHQPIESLTILRSIPNLLTFRPCDLTETAGSYKVALDYDGPSAIVLSRQTLPNTPNVDINKIKLGAYIIYESLENYKFIDKLDLIIVATGSEVSLAIDVVKSFTETADLITTFDKLNIRVISMVSTELFDKTVLLNPSYKELILPKNVKKLSIEAGSTLGWFKYVDYVYGIDKFGESGKIDDIKQYFGFTVEHIKNYIRNEILKF